LHSKLAAIGGEFALPRFDERVRDAVKTLDHPGVTADLSSDHRLLLRTALVEGMTRLASTGAETKVLHGSPHRLNILSANGVPTFIDFETVELGPVEWDLAHLEPKVADLYPAEVDHEVLATCRMTVSLHQVLARSRTRHRHVTPRRTPPRSGASCNGIAG
jgi:aminoglycoside phosphotransferase (APT) family kinase protein